MTRQDPNDKTRPQPEDKTPTRRQGPNDKRKIKRNKRSRCLRQKLLWTGPNARGFLRAGIWGGSLYQDVFFREQQIKQFKEKLY